MRRWMGVSVGVALAATAAVACGSEAARMVGDAMVDAAGRLEDAGRALDAAGDGAISDASAGPPMTVLCDQEHVWRVDYGDGRFSETIQYYADVPLSVATDGTESVAVTLCDQEIDPPDDAAIYCPASPGVTCTGSPIPPGLRCQTGFATFDGTRARVYCGSSSRSVSVVGGPETMSTRRWRSVTVRTD